MLEKIYKSTDADMAKANEAIVHQLSHLRTGRAHTGLVDSVMVDAYGSEQLLKAVASISAPDGSTIMITPWDRTLVAAVEKAIQAADLGMNPSSDGTNVRLNIPALTQERRKEIAKEAHKIAEAGKVSIRDKRHHANDEIKKLEKDKEISEDDRDRGLKKIQELTDKHCKEIEDSLAEKEKEIMTV